MRTVVDQFMFCEFLGIFWVSREDVFHALLKTTADLYALLYIELKLSQVYEWSEFLDLIFLDPVYGITDLTGDDSKLDLFQDGFDVTINDMCSLLEGTGLSSYLRFQQNLSDLAWRTHISGGVGFHGTSLYDAKYFYLILSSIFSSGTRVRINQ